MNDMRKKRWMAWVVAAACNAVMLVAAWRLFSLRYDSDNNYFFLQFFSGFDASSGFNLFIHWVLAYPLYWLGQLAPHIPWFSLMLVALQWGALTVCQKSILQCFLKSGRPMWQGLLVSVYFLLCMGLRSTARIEFTTAAGLAGCAAVLQIMSIDPQSQRPGAVFASMMAAAALWTAGYAIRQMTALPMLAMCGMAVLWLAGRYYWKQRSLKPLVVSLAVIAALIAVLTLGREYEIRAKGMQDYLAWNDGRIQLVDYYGAGNVTDALAQQAGWSPETLAQLSQYYLLNGSVTTDSLALVTNALAQQATATAGMRISRAVDTLQFFFQSYPAEVLLLLCGPLAAVAALAGLLQGRRSRWDLLMLIASIAAFAGMLAVLAFRGRMTLYGAMSPFFACYAFFFGLLPNCLPTGRSGRALLCCAFAALIAHGGVSAVRLTQELKKPYLFEEVSPITDLELYAGLHPDRLILYDHSIQCSGAVLFPAFDEDAGMPHNMLYWGGWGVNSPEYRQMFAAFGVDSTRFTPDIYLRDDVYIACASPAFQPAFISDWVSKELNTPVHFELRDHYGVIYLYQVVADEWRRTV